MSKQQLKELIYDLENILKLDKRFKKNSDNRFKKIIKTMYLNGTKQPIINVGYVGAPVISNTNCPEIKEVIKEMTDIEQKEKECNCKPCVKSNKCELDEEFYKYINENIEEVSKFVDELNRVKS